jgi:hypothetical protein
LKVGASKYPPAASPKTIEGKDLNTAVQNVNYNQTLEKTITETATGVVGGSVGAGVGKAANAIVNSTKGVQSTMSKNIKPIVGSQ